MAHFVLKINDVDFVSLNPLRFRHLSQNYSECSIYPERNLFTAGQYGIDYLTRKAHLLEIARTCSERVVNTMMFYWVSFFKTVSHLYPLCAATESGRIDMSFFETNLTSLFHVITTTALATLV